MNNREIFRFEDYVNMTGRDCCCCTEAHHPERNHVVVRARCPTAQNRRAIRWVIALPPPPFFSSRPKYTLNDEPAESHGA
jgi:hypothetical protein